MNPVEELKKELEKLKKENLYRERFLVPEDVKTLCSNNYLNLSKHPKVIKGAEKTLKRFGLGSGASQLVSGYTELHRKVEETLKELKKVESCVTFGSGFLANLGTISALFGKGDVIFSDELNHASIIDGIKLSKAQKFIYKHKDIDHLKELLGKYRKNFNRCGIATDSVFSMDGDIAPLKELVEIAENYKCFLLVDDAHATGTLGYSSLSYFQIEHKPFIVEIGTFSKALGGYGAYVCSSEVVTDYLINRARSLIFSTSLPPPVLGGILEALKLLKENPELIRELQNRAKFVKNLLRKKGFDLYLTEDITPIVPIMVYDEKKALQVRDCLLEKGFFVQAIRYPTVPKGKARLRLTVTLEYPLEVYKDFVEILTGCF
jgi:8-amino-7-oxononanoate synthase